MGSGDPVILIHGLFGMGANLGTIAKPLSEHYRVISVDLRNHGRSFHHPSMRLGDMAGDVARLMDHYQLRSARILGHSLGGKVAMQLALERPVVRRLMELVRLRASHPAFDGELDVGAPSATSLRMCWKDGLAACTLHVDVEGAMTIEASEGRS